ncbi:MAG: hypothetical protein ACYCWW_09940 [Deltaproteobacteria bacterium]
MLDAFIIEELKRRERERQDSDQHQPRLPVPGQPGLDDDEGPTRQSDDDKPQRGVVIIDLAL